MGVRKVALFAFNGDPICFAHVLLNALDMKEKGFKVKVVIEGTATTQVAKLADAGKPFANLYKQVLDAGLIDCVCEACSNQTASCESALKQGLALCSEMGGHPKCRALHRGWVRGAAILKTVNGDRNHGKYA